MSIYLKVFLVVIVGTVGGWFAINHALYSTEHYADNLSTATTSHLSTSEEVEQEEQSALNAEDQKAALQTASARQAIDQSFQVSGQNGQAGQAGSSGKTKVIIRDIKGDIVISQNLASLDLRNIQGEEEEEIEEEELEEAEEEKLEDEEEVEVTESERADSDSDTQKRGGDGKPKKSSDKNKKKSKPAAKKNVVQALDIAYALPKETNCVMAGDQYLRIGIDYRIGSYAIKGQSLSGIDQLVNLHRQCRGGKLLILQNSEGVKDTEERLIQLRQDEIKYYLLQRNIPKDDMIFADTL